MFEQKIAEAKAVPILEIAQLFCEKFTYEKNKPTCACPRHKDEHIGNMAYYERTNTFYCFSCRTKFDGIDLVRFTLGVDLKTAVSEIEKHSPGYFSAQEVFTENDNFLSFDEIKKLGISPVLSFDKERISSATLSSGIYKVSLDMDSLPITVAPLTNDYISKTVKIEDGLTTRLELPLVSTVGSVSGTLKISDDFQRDLKITDFVVIIEDSEGNEVNYSTVTNSGEFYISGLAPGKYTLKLDDRYIDAYGLEKLQNLSERTIFIPYDYENPTDVMNQNLEYKTLSL